MNAYSAPLKFAFVVSWIPFENILFKVDRLIEIIG